MVHVWKDLTRHGPPLLALLLNRIWIAFVPQPSRDTGASPCAILGMNTSFINRHLCKIKRAHPLNARNIDPVLVGRRAALVEGIDAAFRTEVMLGFASAELIKRQRLLPLGNSDIPQIGRYRHSASHTAERAVAPACSSQAVGQAQRKPHGPAMAGCLVNRAIIAFFISHGVSLV